MYKVEKFLGSKDMWDEFVDLYEDFGDEYEGNEGFDIHDYLYEYGNKREAIEYAFPFDANGKEDGQKWFDLHMEYRALFVNKKSRPISKV